jgi:antitoxin YefM
MYTTYRLKADELDDDFLQSVKALFHDKVVEIAICDAAQAEEDETDYLLKNPANRQRLLNAIDNVEQRQGIVEVSLTDL